MTKITLDELHNIISKPDNECDDYELHLKHCWNDGNSKSILYLTGLDVSEMIGRNDYKLPNQWTYIRKDYGSKQ